MIIEYNFAQDLLEEIDEQLLLLEEQGIIQKNSASIAKLKPDFQRMRKVQNYSLPISSVEATDIVAISRIYYEISMSNWEEDHPTLIRKGLSETINSSFETSFPSEAIGTAIYDKISRLVLEYDLVIQSTIESNGLFGIEDETKILLIHLNKYQEILSSHTEQIDLFKGLTLNKTISDLILKIYIRFINRRLKILNPELPRIEKNKKSQVQKIRWEGSQKNLCELFVVLQEKGWIEEFRYGDISKMAKSICSLFDLTLTKKNPQSDPEASFYQILKGTHNHETRKRGYNKTIGPLEQRKFNEIKENRR